MKRQNRFRATKGPSSVFLSRQGSWLPVLTNFAFWATHNWVWFLNFLCPESSISSPQLFVVVSSFTSFLSLGASAFPSFWLEQSLPIGYSYSSRASLNVISSKRASHWKVNSLRAGILADLFTLCILLLLGQCPSHSWCPQKTNLFIDQYVSSGF